MKHRLTALALAALLALCLGGCGADDLLYYLYGGDAARRQQASYTQYDGSNGVSVVYDASVWETPTEPQTDTVSLMTGTSFNYTVVLLQVTDSYTDFLAQSAEELKAETATVEYELTVDVPDAATRAVRYDCGSYQAIFAQIDYDAGLTVYVSAMTHSGDETPILELLGRVFPTGQTPESAAALLAQDDS